jgi:hypothetical protein
VFVAEQMGAPYGRIVLMQVTLIAGGFLTMALGAPVAALLILVVGKTILDLRGYVKERRKAADRAAALLAETAVDAPPASAAG